MKTKPAGIGSLQSPPIVKAKYSKGEQTLRKIREAALQAILSRGYHRTSVCELVKQSKLTRGAFYNYYNSLDDCLSDLIAAMQESIRNHPDAIEYYQSLPDPSLTVKKVKLTMYLVIANKYRFILLPSVLLQEKDLPASGLRRQLETYMQQWNLEWLEVIKADQDSRAILPSLAPETIAAGIMNLLTGFFHNCEQNFQAFNTPMEQALVLFLLATLTEEYRENNRLKRLLPETLPL
ncbi:MAG: TetR/AcrR family transcriptional regulator [Leptospiraceae bacterium]|nr:TetR/AcrR family transcriptional regulator [Leptospiraceae bacterium]